MEMCCEPLYLVAQAFLFVRLRVVCESVIVFVRTATFTVLVLSWSSRGAVIAFSAAQLLSIGAYTVTLYMYFWWYLRQRALGPGGTCLTGDRTMDETKSSSSSVSSSREGNASESNRKVPPLERRQSLEEDFPFRSLRDFLPKRLENDSQMDTKLLRLTWSFMKQGLLKQLLTDGERYVMTIFTLLSFAEQGTFDVVNNLGSLAARFLFRPIEESCYFYFSQVVQRDAPIKKQSQVLGSVGSFHSWFLTPSILSSVFQVQQDHGFPHPPSIPLYPLYFRYNKTMVYLSIAFLATRLGWVLPVFFLGQRWVHSGFLTAVTMGTRIVQATRFIKPVSIQRFRVRSPTRIDSGESCFRCHFLCRCL
ncbi:hypothetical protein WDU94_001766 [Cyamophila willieti]